jgi:hypothetical protein
MLRCWNYGVTATKLRQIERHGKIRWAVLHAAPYPRKSFMFGQHNSECLVATVSHDRGWSPMILWTTVSWYSVGPSINLYGRITANVCVQAGWAVKHITWSKCYFRTNMQFSKMTVPCFTQLELFSHIIVLKTVQNLYEPIPRMIVAQQCIN